ncbi:MAG: amidophosphoribosyltransferase [Candidatus Thermoplasmatota archaeon]
MCGIIGIFGRHDVSLEMFHGLKALQHRGQSSAGFITYDGNIYPKKDAGFVENLVRGYNEHAEIMEDHPGHIGIGHTRYSTTGSDTRDALKKNAQPEYLINPFLAACHNGNIINGGEIRGMLSRSPRTDCDIQYLLLPMADALPSYNKIDFDSIVEAGAQVMDLAMGSYSALFLTAGKQEPYLIAMTDPHKIRPMVMGRKDDTWYIASESAVLTRLGVTEFRDVDSGTILSVDPKSEEPQMKKIVHERKYHCMFEYIYFADPASWIEGRSVHRVRTEIGAALGRRTPVKADIVVPLPESGRRYSVGFSSATGIPMEEGLRKDKDYRIFIFQTQEQRDQSARDSLVPIDAALDGKDIVLVDDSLVRGTNMRRVIEKVRAAGARKVHVRIGCPPLVAPCFLGIDMRSKKEFIAVDEQRNEMRAEEEIARLIGADSLAYGTIDSLRRAIIGSSEDCGICTGCINFPDGYPEDMRPLVEELYSRPIDDSGRAYE